MEIALWHLNLIHTDIIKLLEENKMIKTNINNAFNEARKLTGVEGQNTRGVLIMAVDRIQKLEKELLREATEIELTEGLRKLVDMYEEEKAGWVSRGDVEKVASIEKAQALIESFLPPKPVLMTKEAVGEAVEAIWQGIIDKAGFSIVDAKDLMKELMSLSMKELGYKADKAVIAGAVKSYFK